MKKVNKDILRIVCNIIKYAVAALAGYFAG